MNNLVKNIPKSLTRTRSRLKFSYDCSRSVSCLASNSNNKKLLNAKQSYMAANTRPISISSKLNNSKGSKLNLMNFPRVLIPGIFDLMKLRLRIKFNMRNIDPDFTFNSFSAGAIQGLIKCSNLISKGNFDELKGLVYDEAIQEIKDNFSKLTLSQKTQIGVNENDLLSHVPYDFEIKGDFVRLGVVFYYIPNSNYSSFEAEKNVSQLYNILNERRDDILVANYEYVGDYRKGHEDSSWTISKLNHWHIIDSPNWSDNKEN